MSPKSLVQWRFLDGRPGHESQVLGLSEALASVCPAVIVDVPVDAGKRGLRALRPSQFRALAGEPRPHLLIGAGHATHAALIRCRQLFGGRSVVLMKPSLPPSLFDLCLVPRHDRLLLPWPNVVRTAGAINRMRPSQQRPSGRGLALIGGPSRHFLWSDDLVRHGIRSAVADSSLHWTVATSRRTPASLIENWHEQPQNIAWQTTGNLSGGEIAALIGEADRVVVTSDSMSMICEALTSGAAVDLIELPARGNNRLSVEVQSLVRQGFWPGAEKRMPEADRCAALVLQRLFPGCARPASEPTVAGSGMGQALLTALGSVLKPAVLRDVKP